MVAAGYGTKGEGLRQEAADSGQCRSSLNENRNGPQNISGHRQTGKPIYWYYFGVALYILVLLTK